MDLPDLIESRLQELLAKLPHDKQTQTAARSALDKHRAAVRVAASSSNNRKVRADMLAAADQELLNAIGALSNTEHDEQIEVEPSVSEDAHDGQDGAVLPGDQPARSSERKKRKRN